MTAIPNRSFVSAMDRVDELPWEGADESRASAVRVVDCRVRRGLERIERRTDRTGRDTARLKRAGRRRPMGDAGRIDRSELRGGGDRIERQAVLPRRLSVEPGDTTYSPDLRHRVEQLAARTAAPAAE